MSTNEQTFLAADTINGVYLAAADEHEGSELLIDEDFYSALSKPVDGVIYGRVSDEIAQRIAVEYGIN